MLEEEWILMTNLSMSVECLDTLLGPITNDDFILVGSLTGQGKTELLVNIAMENAFKGKKIHYIALNHEEHEILRRIKYKKIAEIYYQKPIERENDIHFNDIHFIDWDSGKLESKVKHIEKEINDQLKKGLNDLHIFCGRYPFELANMIQMIEKIKDETDLIIIDDLFFIETKIEKTREGMEEMLNTIKNLSLKIKKPIILATHITRTLDPMEFFTTDFDEPHNIKSITKFFTKVVLMSPGINDKIRDHRYVDTYFDITKKRQIAKARCSWNFTKNQYEKHWVSIDV